jgi:peptide/nickel transport system permease protein
VATTSAQGLGAPVGPADLTPQLLSKRRGQLRLIFDRFRKSPVAVMGFIVLALITVTCILGPLISHVDPDAYDLSQAYAGISAHHWLGTDDLGRDTFIRLLYGGRVSLVVGAASMALTLAFAILVGALAGFYGGWIDNVLMRIVDAWLSVPYLILALVLSGIFGNGSPETVIVIIAVVSWAGPTRIVRGEFLSIKEREFVLAARTIGASDVRLMLVHLLPNAAGPIIVSGSLLIGGNIVLESILSFFGFGVQLPTPSWGNMVQYAQAQFSSDPLMLFVPALTIVITVLCFYLMGDGLRDALDPYKTER